MQMVKRLSVLILTAALLQACGGDRAERPQPVMIEPADMTDIGRTAFEQIKAKSTISADFESQSRLRCVVGLLVAELPEEAGDWDWQTVVFDDPAVDAFALPGAAVGINSGMLDLIDDETELAAVLSHELAHLQLRQPAARVSAAFTVYNAIAAVQTYRGAQGPQQSRTLYALLGLGSRVGLPLAYTSADESAAFRAGLELSARAGYDPALSLRWWQKLVAAHGDSRPAWLSLHTDPSSRLAELHVLMPQLRALFETARASGKAPDCRSASG